jgi:hypothetical protein
MQHPNDNPHTAQVQLNAPGYQYWVTPSFQRILNTETAPVRKYKRREHCIKTTLHWGQRKLLLSEIEFLTQVIQKDILLAFW